MSIFGNNINNKISPTIIEKILLYYIIKSKN